MAEFGGNSGGGSGSGGFEDNWDLQAIVRGGGSSSDFFTVPDSCYLDNTNIIPQNDDDNNNNGGFFFSFPNDNLSFTDDLQDFYKPFYPLISDSSSSSSLVVQGHDHIPFAHKIEFKEELQVIVPKQHLSPPPPHTDASVNISQTPKYRRRKNQNKRIVVQAAGAEGLPSDTWAWRKYGQKPIKGSPYPRSYYRCSTSRGCLARKQVEQSCTDEGVFIISYAAEHNHVQPIKKNALAGTTRQKFPTQINPAAAAPWTTNNINVAAAASEYKENSCNSNWSSSAPSPMSGASNIDQDGCSSDVKLQENTNSDIKMEEEFFAGLEDLDGLISELANGQHHYSSQMFSMNFYR